LVSSLTLADMRRFAVARSLFTADDLQNALDRFGFVQADPIRAPARAQDLTLRQRLHGYRAGELERRYETLAVEEDFFINYGFVTRGVRALLHPRPRRKWPRTKQGRADAILAFIRERGAVHPREVEQRFQHGRITNYWGGTSNATTHLLELMHFRGDLRIVRRDGGVRVYGVCEPSPGADVDPDSRLDALIDVIVGTYAPLPAGSLSTTVRRLRWSTPQWVGRIPGALARAKRRLARAKVDGIDWYWPDGERTDVEPPGDAVRMLAPFDPVVWDRTRFELLWGWPYRFEAYTPVSKRRLGYYALPLLWRDRVIGWGNAAIADGVLQVETGYVGGRPPRERAFARELEAETARLRTFLAAEESGEDVRSQKSER
jgi:uncharacterized protein YcaQ